MVGGLGWAGGLGDGENPPRSDYICVVLGYFTINVLDS